MATYNLAASDLITLLDSTVTEATGRAILETIESAFSSAFPFANTGVNTTSGPSGSPTSPTTGVSDTVPAISTLDGTAVVSPYNIDLELITIPGSTTATGSPFTTVTAGAETVSTFIALNTSGGVVIGAGDQYVAVSDYNTGSKADTLIGGAYKERLLSMNGSNVLVAGSGANTLVGGSGADTLLGGGASRLLAGSGANVLKSSTLSTGSDTLFGGTGADLLVAQAGKNKLIAGTGANTLQSAAGASTLIGGTGADLLVAQAGNNKLIAGAGANTLQSAAGANTLIGGTGADLLVAQTGNNVLIAGAGANTLQSGSGSDRLVSGGDGTFQLGTGATRVIETISGAKDTIFTGSGADTVAANFGLSSVGLSIVGSSNANNTLRFLDYSGQNTIVGGAGAESILLAETLSGGAISTNSANQTIIAGTGAIRVVTNEDSTNYTVTHGAGGVSTVTFGDSSQTLTITDPTGQNVTLVFAGGNPVKI